MVKAFENCPFNVLPYDQSSLIKTPEQINLNYTNQEFWSLKTRLVDFIKERYPDDFNDFVESDLSILNLEIFSFVGDTLSFKIDQIANEIFIDTVTEVDNAFRLSRLVGFIPQPPISARSLWSATTGNTLNVDLNIPSPVTVNITTEDGAKTIELFPADENNEPIFDEDIFIAQGSFVTTSIVGLEGTTRRDFFRGTGEINQFFQLGFGPVIWKSIRVEIDGVQWEEVAYFSDSQARKEFRVEYNSAYSAFILFGNNRAGMIPSSQSDILVTYRIGGGVSGNIVTGSVEVQRSFEVVGFDFNVPVTFRNYTKGEFGYAGDTIDDIKRKLPPYLRSQNRAVTGDDYQALAEQFSTPFFGQVGKALATLRNHGCASNLIDLYILTRDGTDGLQISGNELKVALYEELNKKKMLTDTVCIKDGVILLVDISIDVIMDKFYRKFEEEFKDRINKRVNTFFSLNNWEYGEDLKNIDLIKEVSDIKEIRSLQVGFTTSNPDNSGDMVVTKFYEIIRPDTTELTFFYE